jgi:acetoin utilization deacetylase AcuC-like enzyme
MFYAAHRTYLNPPEKSIIEPPLEFKSKRQLKQLKASRDRDSRNEDKLSFHVNFQKKQQDGEETDQTVKKFRKVANIIRNTITLDHFSSVHREDWTEEVKAGVKMWVNKETGEVCDTCPWENASVGSQTPIQRLLKQKSGRKQNLMNAHQQLSGHTAESGMGTGSLVYDGSEVQELFKLLESSK